MSMAVQGLMTFALSNQRHAWLPCHFMSFKTVFKSCYDNGWKAKKLSAIRWCIDQAVIEPWTLQTTFGSTNRSVTRSLQQLQVQPLCRSAVSAFLGFAWKCPYYAHWLLMMSRWQWRLLIYFQSQRSSQVYLKPVLQLVTQTSFTFDGRCSYLAH